MSKTGTKSLFIQKFTSMETIFTMLFLVYWKSFENLGIGFRKKNAKLILLKMTRWKQTSQKTFVDSPVRVSDVGFPKTEMERN